MFKNWNLHRPLLSFRGELSSRGVFCTDHISVPQKAPVLLVAIGGQDGGADLPAQALVHVTREEALDVHPHPRRGALLIMGRCESR